MSKNLKTGCEQSPRLWSIDDELVQTAMFVPGGVELLENISQREVTEKQYRNLPWTGTAGEEAVWTQAGFTLGPRVKEDGGLFREATWPKGWKLRGTSSPMWSDIIDADGRERGAYGFKGSFYDSFASASLHRRFGISYGELTAKYIPGHRRLPSYSRVITDRAYHPEHPGYIVEVIQAPEIVDPQPLEHWSKEYWDANREELIDTLRSRESQTLAEARIAERFPDHKNPNAYWDMDR